MYCKIFLYSTIIGYRKKCLMTVKNDKFKNFSRSLTCKTKHTNTYIRVDYINTRKLTLGFTTIVVYGSKTSNQHFVNCHHCVIKQKL